MRMILWSLLFLGLQPGLNAISFQDNGSVIKGKVTDQEGNALPGADIIIENTFLGVHSGKDGSYIFKGLKDGNYKLRFSFIGFEVVEKEISLKSEIEVNIILTARSFVTEEVFVNATRAGEYSPLAYTTINRESISKNNIAQDIPYILSYTPSMVVSSDAGTGIGYTNINIRGTDIKRINVTIDGIPVNDAESHGVWWVDLPDLASSADNVQIQRGVGTSTNGAGAFGATINFQTSDIKRDPYGEINTAIGSFRTSKSTISFGTGLIKNMFALDARLSKIWSDGYIDRAFSDLMSFYISGKIYRGNSILKLMVFSGVEHTYQAWYGVPKDSLATNRTYNPYSYENETDNYWQDNYQLHYSKKLNGFITANVALHYTKGEGYYENLETGEKFSSYNLPDAIFSTDTILQTDFITQKWLKNDFYGITYSFNYKKNKINTIIGGGWNQYSGDHFGEIIWAKIVTFNNEKYRWYFGTGDKKDFNTFFKVNYLLSSGINVFADLQLRNINYAIKGFDDNLKNVAQAHIYNFFNPKAGLFYKINDNHKIYASFAVSHREPDRANFTDADPGKTPLPEKLTDYEAGYEYNTTRLIVKGNFFFMDYRDPLILTGEINNVGAPVLTNVAGSHRTGIELESQIRFSEKLNWYWNMTLSRNIIPVFEDFTDNWDTWVQEKVTLKNKIISFSPSMIACSVIEYDLFKNFQLSFNSKYVGKQFLDNTQNTDRMLNKYIIHNLSVSYTINNKLFKELNIQFTLNNLFNRKYETNGWVYKYFENGSLHISDGYFPQAGTNLLFKIGIKI